jgi:hypothetical protein
LKNDLEVISQRIKVYNKWVHLLTSGQKKWISMNLNKIFDSNVSFYIDKILSTREHGFGRLELSDYFYSKEDSNLFFKSIASYEAKIEKTLEVLNSLP